MNNMAERKIQILQQLRALSVIVVVLYHMGLPLESGFLGVDIFFFISGYVVTSVLENKYLASKKSLKSFYINRFWRLFPVLIFTMIFTLVMSTILQTAHEISVISKHIVWAILGLSNLIYYKESGVYGTSSTENNPLIHLWSLSVEFQFYLIFPLLYAVIFKFKKSRIILLLAIILTLSAILYPLSSNVFGINEKVANPNMLYFYLVPFRFFEFIFGALTYNLVKRIDLKWKLSTKFFYIILLTSIPLIFFSTNISDTNKHSKTILLMLLLGTVLIIARNKPISENIFQKYLEKTGMYAYSLYLLHLPLIILTHIHFPNNKIAPIYAGLISIPLSIGISHIIEFKQINRRSIKSVTLQGVVLCLLIVGLPFLVKTQKISNSEILFGGTHLTNYKQAGCNTDAEIGSYLCSWNYANFSETIFVVGDSQASFALDAIVPAAIRNDLKVVSGSRAGCPFIDEEVFSFNESQCAHLRDSAWSWIRKYRPKYVVIANLSTGYLTTSRKTVSNPGGKCPDINGMGCKGYEISLQKTIERIQDHGSNVILLQTIPNFSNQFNRNLFDFYPKYRTDRDLLFLAREPSYIAESNIARKNLNLQLVDPFIYLCEASNCPIVKNGVALYSDTIHISTYGAKFLEPKFSAIFAGS